MSDESAPQTPLVARVLGSVAGELEAIGADGLAPEHEARLRRASELVRWVHATVGQEPGVLEGLTRSVVASLDDNDPTAPRVGVAIRRLLDARRGPEQQHDAGPEPAPPSMDPAEVAQYLRSSRGESHAEVHSTRVMTGGFSKRTILVDATFGGQRQEIVLRQVPPSRRSASLLTEYRVLEAVHAAGLPAPEPLWIEPEQNRLGGAFFVTRRARGSTVGDVWGAEAVSSDVCLDVARLYARLHQLDPGGLVAPISPRSTQQDLESMIAWQEETLAKRGIVRAPELVALLAWLRANMPAASGRPSLLHGDAAFSNLIIDDGEITAVLDWEASHIGNPAEELAYLRSSIEPIMPWPEFLGAYGAAGGEVPDDQALRFFAVWGHTWRYMGCLWLRQTYERTGQYESAVAAYVNGPRFLRDAVDTAFPLS